MSSNRLTHGATKLLQNLAQGMTLAEAVHSEGSINIDEAKTILAKLADGINSGMIDMEWEPIKFLIVYTDGAAKGNPGPAGAGIMIKDNRGNKVTSKSVPLGSTTNNIAEYSALYHALELIEQLKPDKFEVRTDSELMFKQLTGQYKISNPGIKEIAAKIHKRLSGIGYDKWTIKYIPREENTEADHLANIAANSLENRL